MVSPRLRWSSPNVEIWHGDARDVAAAQPAGSFSLAILDGPYAMGKADWDRMKVADLPDWYAPHLDDVGRICAESATLYLWNTAEGWATLHPGIVARGWALQSLIVWDKVTPILGLPGSRFPEVTEFCGLYQRGRPAFTHPAHSGRRSPGAHIRRTTNVWRLAPGAYHDERLKGPPGRGKDGRDYSGQIHPCQKPLAFADRMIRASSRPGDRVWAPFGGTCREAVAVETMAHKEPDEARYCVTAELDADGRDYLGAVCRVLDGGGVSPGDVRQPSLFGGAP